MRRIVIAAIAATIIFTGACSSSSDSARSRYSAFVSEYGDVANDIAEAFGSDDTSFPSFDEYVTDYDCTPWDEEGAALALVFLGPTLASHNLDAVAFVRDMRELDEAIRAEGYCNGTASTTTTEPTIILTPTTTDNSSSIAATCYEALDTINSGLDSISSGVDAIPYVDAATRAEFMATAEEFVTTAIQTTDMCASVDPRFVELGSALRNLRTTIQAAS